MKTNGKYEGSDAPQEFQDDMALIAGLYPPRLERAALLGLGPGRTLATLHDMPFRHIDAIEYSPAIVEAARAEFPAFTRGVLSDRERVALVIDDGRNHLQAATQRNDVIVVAISGAAFAGAGAIYSRDFFEVLRDRLAPGGVVSLWLQLHHVPERDVRSVLATLAGVFAHLHVYTTPAADQSFLIASLEPLVIDARRAAQLSRRPRIRGLLEGRGMRSLLELAPQCVLGTRAELERYLAGGRSDLLTDMRPLFEYRVPVGLALEIRSHDLQSFSELRLPPIEPAPDEGLALGLRGLRALYGRRYEEALDAFERSRQLLGEQAWQPQSERARLFLDLPG
jgi:spermidine synthase